MLSYSSRTNGIFIAGVAQLAEQLICNQQVAGSSPITSSTSEQTLLCSDFFVQKSVPCHIVPPFTAFLKAHRTLFSYAQITKVFHSSFSLSSTQQLTGLPIIPNKKAPPRGAFLILSYDHINFDHVSMTVTHNQPVIHIRIESLSVQNRNNIR